MAAPFMADLPSRLLSQPQLILFVIAGVVWLIKAVSRAKAAFVGEQPRPAGADQEEPAQQVGPVESATTAEERALLVRQDILRKTAQRRADAAALLRSQNARRAPAPPAIAKAAVGAASPAAQTMPSAPLPAPLVSLSIEAPLPTAGALWLEELRTRDAVRRAILVREILGPPVALR